MPTPVPGTTDWVPVWGAPAQAVAADFRYLGDWVAGTYNDGDIVVYQGIAYLCVAPTNAAPVPWTSVGSNYGTSFPASPADGAEFVLVDSITNPSYQWRFRYNAGSTSAYKWEFIGGAPWEKESGTEDAGSAAVWTVDGRTQLVIPRAGDYLVSFTCTIIQRGSVGGTVFVAYDLTTWSGNPAHPWTASQMPVTAGQYQPGALQRKFTGLAAGVTISGYWFTGSGAGPYNIFDRAVTLTPVRCA